jgi:hypothetical protein
MSRAKVSSGGQRPSCWTGKTRILFRSRETGNGGSDGAGEAATIMVNVSK